MNKNIAKGPECAQFADLLPILDDLATPEAAAARRHVNMCAWCQAQQRVDIRLEAALRRAFGPAATPRLSTEEIMASFSENEQVIRQPVSPSPARPRRMVPSMVAFAAVVLLTLLATLVFAAHPRHHTTPAIAHPATPTLTPVPTDQPGTTFNQDILRGISMDSPSDGWAVGSHGVYQVINGPQTRGSTSVLMYHFSNGSWQPVNVDLPQSSPGQDASLNAISMISAHDGWAVGILQEKALLLHYDGTKWNRYPTELQSELVDVQMISTHEGWALSGDVPTTHPVILHYLNGVWTVQYTLPTASNKGNGTLYKLSMLSADDGWAVGTTYVPDSKGNGVPSGVFLHYQHGSWQMQQSFPNTTLNAISMDSPADGWATGLSGGVSSTVYHYQHGSWHAMPGALTQPGPVEHTAINGTSLRMISATNGWLGEGINDAQPQNIYFYHYDGTGWRLTTIPLTTEHGHGISSFTALPTGEAWAVGFAFSPTSEKAIDALVLHYINGNWSVQLGPRE